VYQHLKVGRLLKEISEHGRRHASPRHGPSIVTSSADFHVHLRYDKMIETVITKI